MFNICILMCVFLFFFLNIVCYKISSPFYQKKNSIFVLRHSPLCLQITLHWSQKKPVAKTRSRNVCKQTLSDTRHTQMVQLTGAQLKVHLLQRRVNTVKMKTCPSHVRFKQLKSHRGKC